MLVIGLDVGTTGTKAVVVNENGQVLSGGYKEYGLVSVYGRVTQNACDWWDAAKFAITEAVKSVDASEIKAISLSTQGSSMVLGYWIYNAGRVKFNYGFAMVGAIVLTIMVAGFTVLANKVFKKED